MHDNNKLDITRSQTTVISKSQIHRYRKSYLPVLMHTNIINLLWPLGSDKLLGQFRRCFNKDMIIGHKIGHGLTSHGTNSPPTRDDWDESWDDQIISYSNKLEKILSRLELISDRSFLIYCFYLCCTLDRVLTYPYAWQHLTAAVKYHLITFCSVIGKYHIYRIPRTTG